MLETAIFKPLK